VVPNRDKGEGKKGGGVPRMLSSAGLITGAPSWLRYSPPM
jgi:hypothetical protein